MSSMNSEKFKHDSTKTEVLKNSYFLRTIPPHGDIRHAHNVEYLIGLVTWHNPLSPIPWENYL